MDQQEDPSSSTFDAALYDAERLALDAEAMTAMEDAARAAIAAGDESEAAEEALEAMGAWKWAIRKRVWDKLEEKNIAQFPRPVHHRIPNFLNAEAAAQNVASLDCFKTAKCIKVNPDTPQKPLRFLVLSSGKTLMTPQPRLRTGFFSTLSKNTVPNDNAAVKQCCTSAGVAKYGKPIALDDDVKVDIVVIGSCAVDVNTGARLGKGEGFAELEYGILRMMGAIDEHTPIVTSIHDEQLVDDIPTHKLLRHDVPVDIICTPTRVIYTNTEIPKPEGIYWDLLSPQKLAQVRVLRELKARIEAERGPDQEPLPSGPDEELPPLAVRVEKERLRTARGGGRGGHPPGPRSQRGDGGGGGSGAAAAAAAAGGAAVGAVAREGGAAGGEAGAEGRRLFVTGVARDDGWRDVKRRVEKGMGREAARGGDGDAAAEGLSTSFNVKLLPASKAGPRAALVTFTDAAAAAAALEALAGGGAETGGLTAAWARSQPGNRGGGGGGSSGDVK